MPRHIGVASLGMTLPAVPVVGGSEQVVDPVEACVSNSLLVRKRVFFTATRILFT
jgi:hypothetical protein